MTEAASETVNIAMIDAVLARSRQKSTKVLPRYVKRTRRQIVAGTVKRRALRKADEAG